MPRTCLALCCAVFSALAAVPAAAQPGPAGVMPSVAPMVCGPDRLTVVYQRDVARVTFRDQKFELTQVPAASGAKYEADGDPTTSFWNKGRNGTLTIKGTAYPECTPVVTVAMLRGAAWTVASIAGAPPVATSRVTLDFGAEGRFAGNASCNNMRGTYAATADGLTFGPVATTRKACAPPVLTQEATVVALLGAVKSAQITAEGTLVLYAGDGRTMTAKR